MRVVFKPYDVCPKMDVRLVARNAAIDLVAANASGGVPSTLEGLEPSSNGIDNPASIIGSPDDVFSAMRAADAVKASTPSNQPTANNE